MANYICGICGKPTDNKNIISPTVTLHTCDDCCARISREVEYQSGGERVRERTVICPHCGYKYDPYDAFAFDEGETEEVVCECCEHKFDLEVENITYFSTKRSILEMPQEAEQKEGGEHNRRPPEQ